MKIKSEKNKKNYYLVLKCIFDTVLAIIMLIALSPILIILALAVKIESKGPVFFKQERTGKDGKVFMLYKFRSMTKDNNFSDKNKGDQITKVGHFLRKTSLDELGQLFNIIKGEMSFIGPRPWVTEYSKNFTEEQKGRLAVLPGITGLAQCTGRNNLSIFDKIKADLEYVNNISLKMDLLVIFKTVKCVLKSEGVQTTDTKQSFHNEIEELKLQFERIS